VHDAAAPSPAEADADTQRAHVAAAALVAGGAIPARVKPETAGARAPVVDPSDARHRGRNARLDVVFVSPAG
jgi:outer membrane protein OmpA-like peptidoglycan-associated protein